MKLHPVYPLQARDREMGRMTTWGCLWARGRCAPEGRFRLIGEEGNPVPLQSRITAYWPDGSVKWSSHTADSRFLGDEIEVIPVSAGEEEPFRGIGILKRENRWTLEAGKLTLEINLDDPEHLFERVSFEGLPYLERGRPCLKTEERHSGGSRSVRETVAYRPVITGISLEEEGALQCILRAEGHFAGEGGRTIFPYVIRMKIGYDCEDLSFQYTFLYDGDEHRDFLKGIGLAFGTPLSGPLYNRHVKFDGDRGLFHESMVHLLSWRPRIPEHLYRKQMEGVPLALEGEEGKLVRGILPDTPHWSEYDFCQDYSDHYVIRKKQKGESLSSLEAVHGGRSSGGAAFGSESGSVLVGMRDFWEKYPSGYTFRNLDGEEAEAEIWLWSPSAEAMDFRHYADRGYNSVCYEGYDYFGATPYGIGNTSEFTIRCQEGMIPTDGELRDFAAYAGRPNLYVGDPDYYHSLRAFGYWSLPRSGNETERWIEEQLEGILAFYADEVDRRNWYGMFNYGDFMHTYDPVRHNWRYDMGGYAWDNTELVPTLWLWYYFMRTGSGTAFTLAEKLSRHASEVDVYHRGPYKGLGSRHNVSHWGCPCKEARIAMAAHHRFYYYLTGDRRLEDIFEELKDNEQSFYHKDPLGDFYEKGEMTLPSHARSGPDWSSLCSNWMTRWERFNDRAYRDKILRGIGDIKKAPLRLISGPDFEFDPGNVSLRYIGERTTGGTHLQICMGAPQIWMELGDLIEVEEWKGMLAEYGRFYFLDRERQLEESDGLIGEREFTFPMMAAAMGAYGAWYLKDRETADRTWSQLLRGLINGNDRDGFLSRERQGEEIPWISTNFVAQWCLNAMVALEFIGDSLPPTLDDVVELIHRSRGDGFRRA